MFSALFRGFGELIRFIAGPSSHGGPSAGLGAEYEQMIHAQTERGSLARRSGELDNETAIAAENEKLARHGLRPPD